MLYSVGVVVIPGSFDVDHDAGILLAVVLIVAIGFGLGWIVRGRRRDRRRPVMRAGGFGPHEPTSLLRPGVLAPDVDHDAIATVVPSCGRPASGGPSGGTGTPMARVLILCPCTNTPVPTDLEMDAEAFAAELGDRYLRCPQCQRTHLWTKAMAWLEEAGDEHGNEEGSQDLEARSLLRPRGPGLVKSILIADGDERVAHMFAEVFASHDWRVTWYSDGHRAEEDLGGSAHYDAVLVGYRFEGMDGVDLITRIRGFDHRQDMPIVMVTGTVECAVVAAALAAGADDVLYKPTDVVIVVATVTKCVERRRHQDT